MSPQLKSIFFSSSHLYSIGRYAEAVRDVDDAVMYKYPVGSLHKLFARKARALLAAGRPDLARSFMKTNFRKIFKLTAEQCSKMDEELESVKKEADELYDKAVKEHNAEAGHQWPELKLRYPDFATVRRRLKEVELADGEHARFPAVSAALVLGKDEDRMDGHCFVAKRDIKPGWSLFLRWARPT
jgi:hypothetical protein